MSPMIPPPNPDKPFRRYYNFEYPKEFWYFISSVIFLVAVFQFGSLLRSEFIGWTRRRQDVAITNTESPSSSISGCLQLRRLSLTFVNAYRTVLVCYTVGTGQWIAAWNFSLTFLFVAYLILPSMSSLPFEAHPFTTASVNFNLFADDTNKSKVSGATASDWKELVFLINVRSGFTKRSRDIAIEVR